MSEREEVPMICERCGGAVTEDDCMWSITHHVYTHEEDSDCITSLGERLKKAERERDEARREVAEYKRDEAYTDAIINGQAVLLTAVANALHGEPEPLTMHSHHDLPELVLALRHRAERAERVVEAAKAWVGDGVDAGYKLWEAVRALDDMKEPRRE